MENSEYANQHLLAPAKQQQSGVPMAARQEVRAFGDLRKCTLAAALSVLAPDGDIPAVRPAARSGTKWHHPAANKKNKALAWLIRVYVCLFMFVPQKRKLGVFSYRKFPEKVAAAPNPLREVPRFPGRGSQARFPGRGSQEEVPKQGSQEAVPKQ